VSAVAAGAVACGGESGQAGAPGAADATRIVTDTIEGLLKVESDGLTLQPCDAGGPAWVVEASGADLRSAVAELRVGGGIPLLARVVGESVNPPASGPGADRAAAIRVVQWVYLAEDTSGCVAGAGTGVAASSEPPTAEQEELASAAARARQIRAGLAEARRVEGRLVEGDASSTFTAFLGSADEVIWVDERIDLGEYGSREVEYALSGGALFYVKETGTIRDLSPEGNGELLPRGFEAAVDADGAASAARRSGPGFESGADAAVRGARSHLDRLLEQVRRRVDESEPIG